MCIRDRKNLIAENNGTVTLYAVWTTKGVLNPDVNVQTKTYNGQAQSFTVDNGFTVTYEQNGVAVDSPANAGSYDAVSYTHLGRLHCAE